ncbi:MAG: transporter, partial [Betaproteobacteria bacterium]
MRRFSHHLCLGLFLLHEAAHAFQPLITDDTGTQGSGGNQIEFSLNHDRTTTGVEIARTATFPLVFTHGLTDTLDLFVGASHVRVRPAPSRSATSGGGNPALGLKWRFYENTASQTSLALKPEFALPVSRSGEDAGRGTGRLSYGLTLILTQELPSGAIHANLGSDRSRYRDTTVNPNASVLRASLAPVWDVAEHWKLALDLGVQRE